MSQLNEKYALVYYNIHSNEIVTRYTSMGIDYARFIEAIKRQGCDIIGVWVLSDDSWRMNAIRQYRENHSLQNCNERTEYA